MLNNTGKTHTSLEETGLEKLCFHFNPYGQFAGTNNRNRLDVPGNIYALSQHPPEELCSPRPGPADLPIVKVTLNTL